MSEPPSIIEVAKLAGVSPATVSRVLNASKAVSADARSRVLAAVATLGYKANAAGRNLRNASSRLLLVLVPDFSNPFHSEVIAGIESVVRANNYNLLLADAGDLWSRGEIEVEAVYSRLTDGVISLAPMPSDRDLAIRIPDLPWVACSVFEPGLHVPYVSIDHRMAACDAVRYLINRGHRRIALINSDERFQFAEQRRKGYEDALSGAGIALDHSLILSTAIGGVAFANGHQAAVKLLTLPEPPTAVFAVSDRLAIGACKAFKKAGLRIPDDIAVIGFDNSPVCDYFEPSLTSVAQPSRALGIAATEMLLLRLQGGKPESRTLPHELIIRQSA